MWLAPKPPSQWQLNKLKFNLDHFNIFGEQGVIRETRRGKTTNRTQSTRGRVNPPRKGDTIGVLNHYFLTAFQIEAIGIVKQLKGKSQYLIEIT